MKLKNYKCPDCGAEHKIPERAFQVGKETVCPECYSCLHYTADGWRKYTEEEWLNLTVESRRDFQRLQDKAKHDKECKRCNGDDEEDFDPQKLIAEFTSAMVTKKVLADCDSAEDVQGFALGALMAVGELISGKLGDGEERTKALAAFTLVASAIKANNDPETARAGIAERVTDVKNKMEKHGMQVVEMKGL